MSKVSMQTKILVLIFVILVLISITNCGTKPNIEKKLKTSLENNSKVYESVDGWTINYPASWNKVEHNYIQEESTGKAVEFYSDSCNKEELEKWIDSEIKRKLEATEALNILVQTLEVDQIGNLLVYSYTINSKIESSETLLKNTIFFDGNRKYEFRAQFPPVTEIEYDEILKSFKIIKN